MSNHKIVIIGPYPSEDFRHIGGASILFRDFILFLKTKSFSSELINTLKFKGTGHQFLNFIYVFWISLLKIPQGKIVIFNFNRRSLLYLGPVLFWYAKFMQTRVSIRFFGAFARNQLNQANAFSHFLMMPVFKNADLLFFETKEEATFFKKYNENTFWFPNCRRFSLQFRERVYKRKFVFISQLKIEKGILQILDVIRDLNGEYVIDLYGPVLDQELEYIKQLSNYKGVISSSDVYEVLDKYDVLLLPTFYPGEGYPGIIIEAYSMSIPVITTRWNSIAEIVEDGNSGILIEPMSSESLKNAILKMDDGLYKKLNAGAYEMSKLFQSEAVHQRILTIIQDTIK